MSYRSHFRVVVLLVILLLMTGVTVAEDLVQPHESFPQALGGYFGPFSGSGLHYHRWIGDNGFHVSGGIVYAPFDEDSYNFLGTTLDYSIGGEFQRRVYGEAFTNWLAGSLFLFVGGQHHGFIPILAREVEIAPGEFDFVEELGTYQAEITAGFGIGIELILFRHFSVPVEFGYGATWTVTETSLADAFEVGPNVQVGLRYRY